MIITLKPVKKLIVKTLAKTTVVASTSTCSPTGGEFAGEILKDADTHAQIVTFLMRLV